MKILFAGASSCTGFWFIKTLAASGHKIVCPATKNLADYTGTRRQRIERLKAFYHLVPCTTFGSKNFLKAIPEYDFDLLCHCAADVTNYKSPDFDPQLA